MTRREAGIRTVVPLQFKPWVMKPVILRRDAWTEDPFPEILFLSSDSKGEDVYFKSAEPYLSRGTGSVYGICGGKDVEKAGTGS